MICFHLSICYIHRCKRWQFLYDFAPIEYLFNPWLAVLTFVVAMIGILGSTWLSCAKELFSNPAMLIRPRATKAGKRILFQQVPTLHFLR